MKIADIDLICEAIIDMTYPSGREVYGLGLRPLACWDCVFECHQGHGCLMSVCRELGLLSGRGLFDGSVTVQSSTAECGVSECHRGTSQKWL